MQNIDYYKGLWAEMIKNDKDKIDHLKEIDKVIEFGLELPQKLRDMKHMRNIQSTLPTEIIVVGRKTLCTIGPKVFIQPLNPNDGTIKIANEKEQNILWQFKQMEKRSKHGMIGDIVESALKYDSVATFTVPVSWQIGGQEGALTPRYKAAMNQGGFMSIVENPKNIFSRFSPLGLDMVLNAKVMLAREAVNYYGDKVKSLAEAIKKEEDELYVTVYDFWSYDDRVLWVSKPKKNAEIAEPSEGWILFKEDMPLPFMPWTIVEGGSSLASTADHRIRPLLGPIVHANQLELMLIVQSMAFSEATGYAAAPRAKITSHDGESIKINYGDIQQEVVLKPGELYELIPPPAIDGNLLVIFDRIEASFNRLAGLKALANLDTPSGTAFATVNAQIKAATSALAPSKLLSERALSGIAENILRWTAHTGDDLIGFGTRDGSMGTELITKPDLIDEKEIYVDVTLSHHIPTDELQQINAVTILMKEVGISFVDAAKRLDIPNPEELQDRKRQEMLDDTQYAIAMKKMQAEADLEIREQQLRLEMSIQQEIQAEQMQMAQQMQQGGGENEQSMSNARMANSGPNATRVGPNEAGRREAQSLAARGPGFNPARGGVSPNEANPEGFTRESMTGVDKEGEAI